MTKTYDEIIAETQVVAEATDIGENTAERVGGVLGDIASKIKEQNSEYYVKPSGGIPKSDLSSGVQSSLDKADTALQSHQDISNLATKQEVNAKYTKPGSGIPKTDLASAVQQSLSKADTALQSHQNISGKATVIDLSLYVNSRVPTPEYQLSDNYMPYYTWGEYPIQQWGVIVETDEESNNDFYYVAMFSPDGGATIEYLAFSNKGDWGLLGGYTGIFTEENVPNSILKALNLSMKLSNESVMDALPSTIRGNGVRTIKENGSLVYPVTDAGAVIYDDVNETTVKEELAELKERVVLVEYWDDETPAIHKDSASAGDLFYKTDEGVLYEYYVVPGEDMASRVKGIKDGVIYFYNYGGEFGVGKKVGGQTVMHVLSGNTIEIASGGKKVEITPEYVSVEDENNTMMIMPHCIDVGGPTLTQDTLTKISTMYNYGKSKGWWN